MNVKGKNFIESKRKIISLFFILIITPIILFTIPNSYDSKLGEVMEISGFLLLIFAALGRIWCSIYISGRKDKELCKIGPYACCRNPLYFFSFLGAVGFTLGIQSIFLTVLVSSGFLVYYYFVIKSEEVRLQELFGNEYTLYTQSTPRFFPKMATCGTPDTYQIRPKTIERSLKEVVWFLLAIVAIEILEALHQNGHLVLVKMPI